MFWVVERINMYDHVIKEPISQFFCFSDKSGYKIFFSFFKARFLEIVMASSDTPYILDTCFTEKSFRKIYLIISA